MSRSRKVFLGLAALFVVLLLYASYDISTRTTFPGSKPQLKERILKENLPEKPAGTDSIRADSVQKIR